METMKATIAITLILVGISVLLLGIKLLLVKGGRFPNTHVCGNPALRKYGITSAQNQDKEAQNKPSTAIEENSERRK